MRIRIDLYSAAPMTEFFMRVAPALSSEKGGASAPGEDANNDPETDALVEALAKGGSLKLEGAGKSGEQEDGTAVMATDADGANWVLETDTHSNYLRFSLIFLDIAKIPTNHLR